MLKKQNFIHLLQKYFKKQQNQIQLFDTHISVFYDDNDEEKEEASLPAFWDKNILM